MPTSRRSFSREQPEQRKEALIEATLKLMAETGPTGATVRAIAETAGMSQGMIRHYFSSKEELIVAAYERHMRAMTDATEAQGSQSGTAKDRLRKFVTASLTPPVVDPKAMALWAGFIHMVRRDQAMQDTHERTYYHFRDRLEALISAALCDAGRITSPDQDRRYAIACNAVIDGLWLEGGALPEAFGDNELAEIGLTSVTAIIGLEFDKRKGAP
ncbi:MAG: TetR family transcriptional regulator C-terminal domain-containing protein [Albidovulum sp.]